MAIKRKKPRTAAAAEKKDKPEPPTGHDPFGEETLQRRIWALRVAKNITRYRFARDVGVAYTTVDQWDRGAIPELTSIIAAIRVLNLNGDETLMLLFGRDGRPPAAGYDPDPEITDREIVRMLKELDAPDVTRRALGEYRASQAGRYARMTRLVIQGFVQGHSSAIEAGATAEEALQNAVDEGYALRARALAVMSGGKPLTAAELHEHAAEPIEVRERDQTMEAAPRRPKSPARQATLAPRAASPKRTRRR